MKDLGLAVQGEPPASVGLSGRMSWEGGGQLVGEGRERRRGQRIRQLTENQDKTHRSQGKWPPTQTICLWCWVVMREWRNQHMSRWAKKGLVGKWWGGGTESRIGIGWPAPPRLIESPFKHQGTTADLGAAKGPLTRSGQSPTRSGPPACPKGRPISDLQHEHTKQGHTGHSGRILAFRRRH